MTQIGPLQLGRVAGSIHNQPRSDGRTCDITAILTTFRRMDQVLNALEHIRNCRPCPAEILVHVDGNDTPSESAIRQAFPDVQILRSNVSVGPGGGRNKLLLAASNAIVASFDDDSYPIDSDYFLRLEDVFKKYPQASVVCATVFHRCEQIESPQDASWWTADFIGCGCAYKRDDFLTTTGYVPLTVAYGMEEVDFALRLHTTGKRILRCASLRVFHDTELRHHGSPAVTSASIANLALLAFLRYPVQLWWLGLAQVFRRIYWLVTHQRYAGVGRGLLSIPRLLRFNRSYRSTLPGAAIRSYLRLRRCPVPADASCFNR